MPHQIDIHRRIRPPSGRTFSSLFHDHRRLWKVLNHLRTASIECQVKATNPSDNRSTKEKVETQKQVKSSTTINNSNVAYTGHASNALHTINPTPGTPGTLPQSRMRIDRRTPYTHDDIPQLNVELPSLNSTARQPKTHLRTTEKASLDLIGTGPQYRKPRRTI